MHSNYWLIFILPFSLVGCQVATSTDTTTLSEGVFNQEEPKNQTLASSIENQYINFDSPMAINRLAAIENEYFDNCKTSVSRFHGNVWADQAKTIYQDSATYLYDEYEQELLTKNEKPYPLDCTIYSIEALRSGMGKDFKEMNNYHKQIWNSRGYAGWSVGHILVEEFEWKAYLIVSKLSKEYDACIKNFKKDKKYHVWKQPDIRIEKVFDFDEDQQGIDSLLSQHEFGWGFSEQGWHTWVTRFTELKECNWLGSPSDKYQDGYNIPLFKKTKFTEYYDYDSHVVIFPVKKATFQP